MANQRSFKAASINNSFGLRLFRSLQEQSQEEENCFFSPLNITTALFLARVGARGNTAKQIDDALKVSSFERLVVQDSLQYLNRDLLSDDSNDSHQLKFAIRLYSQEGLHFESSYLVSVRDVYDAELETVDFIGRREASTKEINEWVKEQTNGNIEKLLAPDALSSDSRLVLVNTVYFKAEWYDVFDEENTKDMNFHSSISETQSVSMMHQEGEFDFYHDECAKCKVLVMEYLGTLDMVIALPDELTGLAELESKLSEDLLSSWNKNVKMANCKVDIPKFKFSRRIGLVECLKSMGITDLFESGKADLSGISTYPLRMSEIVHQAFIEVTEEGTEAGAANAEILQFDGEGISPQKQAEIFKADHPFVFFIRDRFSETVIFMGRIVHPVLK